MLQPRDNNDKRKHGTDCVWWQDDDKGTMELNRIRSSLSVFKQLGMGLRQPHLDRTKLCDLDDSQLDQTYIKQRAQLKVPPLPVPACLPALPCPALPALYALPAPPPSPCGCR